MKYDEQFESSLSELAYSALQNSFPDLLQKVVGFQLVDANDDKTKALALFGIKLGQKHYYIPIFFIGGKLKPLELIYDKSEDKFIPLERDWLSLISKSSDMEIGQSTKRPSIGISNPNLEIYATPPRTGRTVTSSAKNEFEDTLDGMLRKASSGNMSIPLAVATADPLVKTAFLNLMKETPEYTKQLLEIYEWDEIKQSCQADLNKYAAVPEIEYAVIEDVLDKRASPVETKKVLEDGLAILDKRAGMAADSYFTDSIMKLEAVKDTGMYKIMDSSGDVKNYFAFQCIRDEDRNNFTVWDMTDAKKYRDLPSGRRKEKITVVDLGEGKAYTNCEGLMGQRNHDERHVLDGIINALPSISEIEAGHKYIFLMQKGGSYVSSDHIYDIRSKIEKDGLITYLAEGNSCEVKKIIVVPGKMNMGRPKENTLAMTADVKAMPINSSHGPSSKFNCQNPKLMESKASDQGISKVELFTDGVDWSVRAYDNSLSGLSKAATADALCLGLNMRGQDAERLIKAATIDGKKSQCFVKQAVTPYPAPPMHQGPQYAPMPIAPLTDPQYQAMQYWPEQYFNEQWHPHTPVGPRDGYRVSVGPDNMAEQPNYQSPSGMLNGAAKTGDKDIMDAGTISSLSKICEIDDLIDTYLPDLMSALDKVARMIFMYWYKADGFADKYTDTEIKETEDMLRNLFKELGKTIHKFKTSKSETARLVNYE